jgi:hypothetical protein
MFCRDGRVALGQAMRADDSLTQLSLDYPMVENYGFVLSTPSPMIPGWSSHGRHLSFYTVVACH